jgi:hypothetical protein
MVVLVFPYPREGRAPDQDKGNYGFKIIIFVDSIVVDFNINVFKNQEHFS